MNNHGVPNSNSREKLMKIDLSHLFYAIFATAFLYLVPLPAAHAVPNCSDAESALEYWRPIKEDVASSIADADELSSALIACLSSPNPELRDRIAYELLTHWLRNDALSSGTLSSLRTKLTTSMLDPRMNATLSRSFSALILAELMRADAQNLFMSDGERGQLLKSTIDALENEHDFRGLDDELGWIHPVAHMSDLLWRFALHPGTKSDQANQILNGVASKVAPTNTSYQFNESDRLARVVSTLIRQSKVSDEKAALWLAQFETPKSMEKWSDAFQTAAGMAELHNTKQFLRALSDQLESVDAGENTSENLRILIRAFTQLI